MLSEMKATKLLNVELPEVKKRNPDLLLQLNDDSILHIELQTYNDNRIAERMLEYMLLIKNRYADRKVRQVVVYVGNDKMRMKNSIKWEDLEYRFKLIDIRNIDCEDMVKSDYISDIILGGLCRIRDEDRYVERLLSAIRSLSENERKNAIKKALTLLRLRPILHSKVEKKVKEESMPLTIVEIEKDPYYKKGVRRGVKVGLKRGRREGEYRKAIETAKRLYKMGLSLEKISEAINLPLDEVRRVLLG
jgi:predicted transposase/invertase (TIGR01784 family)